MLILQFRNIFLLLENFFTSSNVITMPAKVGFTVEERSFINWSGVSKSMWLKMFPVEVKSSFTKILIRKIKLDIFHHMDFYHCMCSAELTT